MGSFPVLIESDWNLKERYVEAIKEYNEVLIESDWNLKMSCAASPMPLKIVLIESDWNLKVFFEPMIRTVRMY